MLHHILHLFMAFFKERNAHRNTRHYRSIRFDRQTKMDILKEQCQQLLNSKEPGEQLAAEQYIRTVLADLKKDFKHDPDRLDLLQELEFALPFHAEQAGEIRKLIRKL